MAEANGGLLARFLHFCSSGMVICNNGTDIANFSNIKYMDEPISCVLRRLADEFDGAFGKNGKDDMSKIKLVAGKRSTPMAVKQVCVWIEGSVLEEASRRNPGKVIQGIVPNELRIMSQADDGEPKCIGTVCESKCLDGALLFDFSERQAHVAI